jgi:hypothetical protein
MWHRKLALSLQPPAYAGYSLADFSTLKMELIRSSETSVHIRSARRHIPKNGILHSHRSENLKSYKCVLFTVGSVCRVKRLTTWWQTFCWWWREWKKQRSGSGWDNNLYAAGFDALVKQWGKCISVGGGYVEKKIFFPSSNIMFYVLYQFVTYLLALPCSINKTELKNSALMLLTIIITATLPEPT